ncbi:MAG: amidophosphoribosyltransferase, partial [Candidatus Azotimanducaceae bacterium]
ERGEALIIRKDGHVSMKPIMKKLPRKACSFERIYFSRAGDADIYRERIRLGQYICPQVFDAINNELDDTVLSFIPNSAEVSFYGMIKGFENAINDWKKAQIFKKRKNLSKADLNEIMSKRVRVEKVAIKDAKLRTFITNDSSRDDLVAHVYDITYGTVKPTDNLVIIDDSIVRGTTLKQSIIKILDRLGPKKIVIVSSAPQIRYPDCYGIDMAKMGDFIAFRAAIELLKESDQEHIIQNVYQKSLKQTELPDNEIVNYVKEIYKPFTAQQISDKVAELVTPKETKAEVNIVFQSIENLHKSCPDHKGDWYFTGNYPTPGGMRVVNKAFIYYIEGRNERAY